MSIFIAILFVAQLEAQPSGELLRSPCSLSLPRGWPAARRTHLVGEALRRTQTHSVALKLTQTQSDAIRRNQRRGLTDESQALLVGGAIRRNQTQSDAIRGVGVSPTRAKRSSNCRGSKSAWPPPSRAPSRAPCAHPRCPTRRPAPTGGAPGTRRRSRGPLRTGAARAAPPRASGARLMREAIRGHQRSSEVIRVHQRSSEVIRVHQSSSEVISEVIRVHQMPRASRARLMRDVLKD